MDRSIPMLVIGLIFGGGIGFMLAAGYGVTLDGHDHSDHAVTSAGHVGRAHSHHETIDLAAGPDAPALELTVTADPGSGWNLRIETPNFRFAPEHASGAHVEGEGHAHVLVNGTKLARLYGHWMHLASLPAGENRIAVTLTTNDHKALSVGGQPVEASQTVIVD